MGIKRWTVRVLSGALLWGGATFAWADNPTVEQILGIKPRHEGVAMTTPSPGEYGNCRVEPIVVQGQTRAAPRRPRPTTTALYDSNGDGNLDIWSFYFDGQEVYRDIDSNFNRKADQFRWLGAAGSRWGVDPREEGRITVWQQISAEEVSQEVLAAVAHKDFGRLQALLISDAELKSLELPESEQNRIRTAGTAAQAQFQALTSKLAHLNDKVQWLHLETASPQCVPADALGGTKDLVHYRNGTILYALGDKHDFLQTGELILVGRSWRIVGCPAEGSGESLSGPAEAQAGVVQLPEEAKPVVAELKTLDEKAPGAAAAPAEVAKYNLERANILIRIVEKLPPAARDTWVRQIADCLSAAAQSSPPADKIAYQRLVALRDQLLRDLPGQSLTAYVVYREMSADYTAQLSTAGQNMPKVQEAWAGRLKKFVEDFPAADDTPDALLQLGMVNEFMGKETESKNWYGLLVKQFGKHPLAPKAQGAIARLDLEGKPFVLAGQLLGNAQPFDIQALKGKVVVLYYWASWNPQCSADFIKLKKLLADYAGKGVELVSVNLDQNPADAVAFLQKAPIPGVHVGSQPGGLDSPLAVQYGVMVLPNLFLVGKDGTVVSRTVQMTNLEDEVKKLLP